MPEFPLAPFDLIDDLPGPAPRYYVHYQDDGPSGPCGQDMATTSPWSRLYVFTRPKAMLDFIHDVGEETFRRNARVVGYWAQGDDHYPPVNPGDPPTIASTASQERP